MRHILKIRPTILQSISLIVCVHYFNLALLLAYGFGILITHSNNCFSPLKHFLLHWLLRPKFFSARSWLVSQWWILPALPFVWVVICTCVVSLCSLRFVFLQKDTNQSIPAAVGAGNAWLDYQKCKLTWKAAMAFREIRKARKRINKRSTCRCLSSGLNWLLLKMMLFNQCPTIYVKFTLGLPKKQQKPRKQKKNTKEKPQINPTKTPNPKQHPPKNQI